MLSTELEEMLKEHGIKPTSNRLLVLRALHEAKRPMSMTELEEVLEIVDKSNVFRALVLFKENHLVHAIEDGSDGVRYEICRSHGGGHEGIDEDMHAHFHCEVCGRTFCFDALAIPQLDFPEDFHVRTINYMAKGICPECRKKS